VAKQLSQRESVVLSIIAGGGTPTGKAIARTMVNQYDLDTGPAGAHKTAASLVRKGLAVRAGTPKLQWYTITEPGRKALRGDLSGEWIAR
jgi:DNA-binding PadR family transcriptional regulator